MKILSPTSGSLEPKGLVTSGGAPRESGFEGQCSLVTGISQDWGKQIPFMEGTHRVLCVPELRKESLSLYETRPDLPNIGGSPAWGLGMCGCEVRIV